MKKILIIFLIVILMSGCVSININIGDAGNSVDKETYMIKNSKKEYTELEDEAIEILDKENITEEEESKVKQIFVTLTDFLFNGGEIKGKTFEELTIEAKSKCYDTYNNIKNKLEERFPNYQEELPIKAKNIVNGIGDKLVNLKEKLKDEYKKYIGEEEYQGLEDTFNEDKENLMDVYETYKPYIDTVKEKSKSAYEKAKEKASEWYQEYKES